jgi:hypothetical protein
MAGRAAAVVATLALAGCSAFADAGREMPREGGVDWEQPWKDGSGNEVPENVVTTYRGAEHCDWQSKVFLVLGRPLGSPPPDASRARMYVRDAEGELDDHLLGRFREDARLPPDARYTGYHRDGVELWTSPSERGDGVYIVDRGRIERWPRARSHIACA